MQGIQSEPYSRLAGIENKKDIQSFRPLYVAIFDGENYFACREKLLKLVRPFLSYRVSSHSFYLIITPSLHVLVSGQTKILRCTITYAIVRYQILYL